LTSLGLAYRALDTEAVIRLVLSTGMAGLRRLAIWNAVGIGDDIIKALTDHYPMRPTVTVLELLNCAVRTSGAQALAESPLLAGVQTLRLSWNNISAEALRSLLASPHLTRRLRRLDLGGASLGAGGLRALAECSNLAGLTHLNLAHTGLDAEGMSALLASPYLRRLTTLHLGSESSAEALYVLANGDGLPRLRELVVGSRSNAYALEALRRRFGPRLIVFHDG
jgi:hypothetical protein